MRKSNTELINTSIDQKKQLETEIKNDNLKFYISKNLFDQEFFNFILKLLEYAFEIDPKNQLEIAKLGLKFFFTVVIR